MRGRPAVILTSWGSYKGNIIQSVPSLLPKQGCEACLLRKVLRWPDLQFWGKGFAFLKENNSVVMSAHSYS